jgi:hypothetical protein
MFVIVKFTTLVNDEQKDKKSRWLFIDSGQIPKINILSIIKKTEHWSLLKKQARILNFSR